MAYILPSKEIRLRTIGDMEDMLGDFAYYDLRAASLTPVSMEHSGVGIWHLR